MTGAALLRKWRTKHGLTFTAAAAMLGVSQATVSDWESGKKVPKLASAVAVDKKTDGAVPADSWVTKRPVRRRAA